MRRSSFTALQALVLLGSSCIHKVERDVSARVAVPDDYVAGSTDQDASADEREASAAWWREFEDPGLERLMGLAFTQNFGLEAARARMRQAEYMAKQAKAPLFPSLGLSAQYGRQALLLTLPDPAQGGQRVDVTIDQERYTTSLQASYEADLWGKLRARKKAAAADYASSRDALHVASITLAANIADLWFLYCAQHRLAELAKAQAEATKAFTAGVESRYRRGLVELLDLQQQEQQLQAILAQDVAAQAALASTRYQLAALVGINSRELEGLLRSLPVPETRSGLQAFSGGRLGVPGDLLLERPDLRAAHQRVLAADYRLGAAIADQLPSLNLNASAGFQASTFQDLLESTVFSLGAGLVQPLIEAGRRRNAAKAARAGVEEAVASFRQAFVDAIAEVERALVQDRAEEVRMGFLAEQERVAGAALAEAERRYRSGLVDFQRVLLARNAAFVAQSALVGSERQRLSNRVQLYRALGGAPLVLSEEQGREDDG